MFGFDDNTAAAMFFFGISLTLAGIAALIVAFRRLK